MTRIEPNEITIRFTPPSEGLHSATVTIFSDAFNVEEGKGIAIRLSGNGVAGASSVAVTPDGCDFGRVLPNTVAYCDVTIANEGDLDLQLVQTAFSDDTPLALTGDETFDPALNGFGQQTMLFVPAFVGPGTATTVRLFANPPDTNEMTGTWRLETSDIAATVIEVPLLVAGAAAPTAVAEVAAINGVDNDEPSPPVQPLDDVILTCEHSLPSTTDGEIVACDWEIVDQPNESSVTLTNPMGETTGFQFNSAGGAFTGLDVAGTYEIGLTVTDDLGLVSANVATVVLNSIPQDAFQAQLTWDDADVDLDLHMTQDGGAWCSEDSCYYGNCLQTSLTRPEWDGVPGATSGDPSLDINDASGFGPENISVDVPTDGEYRIGVHAASAAFSTDVHATVKVFINGALAYEGSRMMAAGRDFWEVAEVAWSGGAITFPVGDYETNWSCP